jgi:threonine/homoserine/homoserine lactone efflux protein
MRRIIGATARGQHEVAREREVPARALAVAGDGPTSCDTMAPAMDPELFARGIVLGFTIAAAVGPISVLCIRRTLAEGRLVGFVSGMGVATADGIYGAIAAFGLTALTDLLVDWRRGLGLVGGAFLVWLAWRTIRSVPGPAATEVDRPRRGLPGAYMSTLGLTLTNPMTILSFAALFVGLGIDTGDLAGATVLTMGVFAGSAAWWVILTLVVGAMRSRLTPRWLHRINVASGLLIGVFGLTAIGASVAS